MLKFNCPRCNASIVVPDDAVGRKCRCPGCGCVSRPEHQVTPIVSTPSGTQVNKEVQQTPLRRRIEVAVLCVFWLLVAAYFLGCFSTPVKKPADSREAAAREVESNKIEAWVAAESIVKNHLRSPGTANFGGLFSGDFQDPRSCVIKLKVAIIGYQVGWTLRTVLVLLCDPTFKSLFGSRVAAGNLLEFQY